MQKNTSFYLQNKLRVPYRTGTLNRFSKTQRKITVTHSPEYIHATVNSLNSTVSTAETEPSRTLLRSVERRLISLQKLFYFIDLRLYRTFELTGIWDSFSEQENPSSTPCISISN